jgi:anti-sigma factor RsiW
MNCQLCQKELDAYLRGNLSVDLKTQVEKHLRNCADCSEIFKMLSLAEEVIYQEKLMEPDLNLTSMVMARLENSEKPLPETVSPFTRIWRPVLITASMAAAIFAGVLIGNIYKPSVRTTTIPVELALMDDAAIESVNVLSNE